MTDFNTKVAAFEASKAVLKAAQEEHRRTLEELSTSKRDPSVYDAMSRFFTPLEGTLYLTEMVKNVVDLNMRGPNPRSAYNVVGFVAQGDAYEQDHYYSVSFDMAPEVAQMVLDNLGNGKYFEVVVRCFGVADFASVSLSKQQLVMLAQGEVLMGQYAWEHDTNNFDPEYDA